MNKLVNKYKNTLVPIYTIWKPILGNDENKTKFMKIESVTLGKVNRGQGEIVQGVTPRLSITGDQREDYYKSRPKRESH